MSTNHVIREVLQYTAVICCQGLDLPEGRHLIGLTGENKYKIIVHKE